MLNDKIKLYYEKEISAIKSLNFENLKQSVITICAAYERDAMIYVFGNGGSGATASHLVCDFNKGINEMLDKKFNLICLNDNIPSILAIANDFSYEQIFEFQLKGKLRPMDLVIAISSSGNSVNIVKAVKYAKEIGCEVIGITGHDGGEVKKLADYCMHVEMNDVQIVEDIHMSFVHMMYYVLTDILKH